MIELCDITLAYGRRTLVSGALASVADSRIVALVGRNGTGKSTLLRAVAGLETSALRGGRILLAGEDVAGMDAATRARAVSVVTTERCRTAALPAEDVVALGRAPYTGRTGRLTEHDRRIVARSLEMVGMEAFARKGMDSLSDGEAQRVMIARALAQSTPVILLDEPTAFLDLPGRYELCMLLRSLAHESGKCVLFSTHEPDIALRVCDGILLIDPPRLLSAGSGSDAREELIDCLFRDSAVSFDAQTLSVRFKKEL
ncbi:MAG: ABC transporter ATP-binding protein [Alistipes sp.]|nr:ABC transporter ATP-binding protein [Alistipes sp.]